MTGEDRELDVVIAGASVAGCTAAIRLAQIGLKVTVFEKKRAGDEQFKRLCTHFIQPSAVPVLEALGLAPLTQRDFSVRTKARFSTPGGVIDLPGGYMEGPSESFALNLERRVLDPALRRMVQEAGADLVTESAVQSVERLGSGWRLVVGSAAGTRDHLARVVVAADGRQSRLAYAVGNQAERHRNDRAARFAYFSGIAPPANDRSLFVLSDDEMTFVYPLPGDRTLLSVYVGKPRAQAWQESRDPLGDFLDFVAAQPEVPSLANAVAEGPLLGYSDYPSLIRQPVHGSIAFVGDAAISLDPMAGVGCGFALSSADLLASAFEGRRLTADGIDEALGAYATGFREQIVPHAAGICGDSLMGKSPASKRDVYAEISGDPVLSREFLNLTGRLCPPARFQRAMLRSLAKQRASAPA